MPVRLIISSAIPERSPRWSRAIIFRSWARPEATLEGSTLAAHGATKIIISWLWLACTWSPGSTFGWSPTPLCHQSRQRPLMTLLLAAPGLARPRWTFGGSAGLPLLLAALVIRQPGGVISTRPASPARQKACTARRKVA